MISSVSQLVATKTITPEPKIKFPVDLSEDSCGFVWNKTAWIVCKDGKVAFEYRGSAMLTCISFNGADLIAIGDSKGAVKIFKYELESMSTKPFIESQVLNTDISRLEFISKGVLAVAGGCANPAARQFVTIIRVLAEQREFKVLCDGTGGPTKAVNDIACSGEQLVAFASDDRSVTLFKVDGKSASFFKTFSDYGGLVGRVVLSEDQKMIAYGSGLSSGRFLVRLIGDESSPTEVSVAFPTGKLFFKGDQLQSIESTHSINGPVGIIKSVMHKSDIIQAYDHIGAPVYALSIQGCIGNTTIENDQFRASIDVRRIHVHDKSTDAPVRTSGWAAHDSNITGIAFLSPGNRIVSVGLDGHVFVWDVAVPLKPIAGRTQAHHGPISAVAVTDDNQILTFGQEDAAIRFFSIP